jgi:hypothetical protein
MPVQSRIATIREELTGRYSANQLAPLIAQVRKLLLARNGARNDETVARVRYAFAGAPLECGDQSGDNDMLREGVAAYRQVRESQTRTRVPLDYAQTQDIDTAAVVRTHSSGFQSLAASWRTLRFKLPTSGRRSSPSDCWRSRNGR